MQQESTLYNVYVKGISGSSIQVLHDGNVEHYTTASAVTGQAVTGVADLHLQKDAVVRIVKKPEQVKGKILKLTEDYITLDGYGEVARDHNLLYTGWTRREMSARERYQIS